MAQAIEGREGEPETRADHHPRTDLGNAGRFVGRHGDRLRYCHPWGGWLVFNDVRWKPDDGGVVMQLAKETMLETYAGAVRRRDDDLRKWAHGSQSLARLKAMIELARSEVPILPESLDTNPLLLNTLTGTVDLRTGGLQGHRREDFITQVAPVLYDPAVAAPSLWIEFLTRIMGGSQLIVDYLQRAVGYSLTGDVRDHVLFVLHGTGANGKSTSLEAVAHVMGDYATALRSEVLVAKAWTDHPTAVADLYRKRFVHTVEFGEGRRLDEPLVKQLTGGDTIRARRMRQDFWSFDPSHKLWLAANHKPQVRGTDHAIWRRIHLIPFEVTIPEHEQDKSLPEALKLEAPGILKWAVDGSLQWQAQGLALPQEVRMATAEYQGEMDLVGRFLRGLCVIHPVGRELAADLYGALSEWCDAQGLTTPTQTSFGRRLGGLDLVSKDRDSATGRVIWNGIQLV